MIRAFPRDRDAAAAKKAAAAESSNGLQCGWMRLRLQEFRRKAGILQRSFLCSSAAFRHLPEAAHRSAVSALSAVRK